MSLFQKGRVALEAFFKNALLSNASPGGGGRHHQAPTLRQLRKVTERKLIQQFLPYETYDEKEALYYNRDNVGFVLWGHPATGLSLTDLKILNGIFTSLHFKNASIQISMMVDTNIEGLLENWKNEKGVSKEPIFDILAFNRLEYLKKTKWESLYHDQSFSLKNYHLVISCTIPYNSDFSLDVNTLEEFKKVRLSFIGTLRSARIAVDHLCPTEFINLMNGILNPKLGRQPILHYNPEELLNKQMVSSDSLMLFDAGCSSIVHEDATYSVIPYHVRQFPQHWGGYQNGELIGSFFNNVLRMPCPFILTLSVLVPDQLSAKSAAKTKFTRATQMADSPVAKYATQWKERRLDWEYTAKKMDSGEKLLKAFYQVLLIAPEGKEQESEQSLIALYDSQGWVLTKSRYIPMHAFLAAMPMGLDQESQKSLLSLQHYSSMLSWNCTQVAPWIGEWKGTKTPMMLFAGRRGQVTFFNPFDNDKGNFNLACSATSGSGKSFFTQEWIFSALGAGGRAFVIDSGHSYRNLCQLLKGTYIDFGEGIPILNPFSKIFDRKTLEKIQGEQGLKDYYDDFMPMLKDLLGQMASPQVALDERMNSCLEKGIASALDEYREKTTISLVVEKCLTQKDLETGEALEYAKDLALMLHPYTKEGMFGRYFEGENNLDLNNQFVVLELDALNSKGPLQSVVLLILMMQINQVMYLSDNKKQIKQVIIDEAWRLLGAGRAGRFIEEGYRVARKHGGSYMTITQKISDYFKSDTASAAFMNSDFVIYLRQKSEELASAEQKGYLDNSDGKVDLLRTLETIQGKYSELAISAPDGMSIVRFCVDPITEKIYSTKAEEVDLLKKYQKEGMSLMEAIDRLLRGRK